MCDALRCDAMRYHAMPSCALPMLDALPRSIPSSATNWTRISCVCSCPHINSDPYSIHRLRVEAHAHTKAHSAHTAHSAHACAGTGDTQTQWQSTAIDGSVSRVSMLGPGNILPAPSADDWRTIITQIQTIALETGSARACRMLSCA